MISVQLAFTLPKDHSIRAEEGGRRLEVPRPVFLQAHGTMQEEAAAEDQYFQASAVSSQGRSAALLTHGKVKNIPC